MEPQLVDSLWGGGGGDGTTPLTPEDREHLIPTHITLRSELNEMEADGVLGAMTWASRRRRSTNTLLNRTFILGLHRRMFRRVWRWAGNYRTRVTTPGVDPHTIQVELHKLLGDTRYWLAKNTYTADEVAIRFHHRLVLIHPFPNGNGRLCRLLADLLAAALHNQPFSWGRSSLAPAEARSRYLAAIRAADEGNYGPLFTLARMA